MNSIHRKEGALLAQPTQHPNVARAKRAAQEFESLLLKQLISSMRPSSDEEGPLGTSSTQSNYYEMFDAELARELAKAGGIGLGDMVGKALQAAAPAIGGIAGGTVGGALAGPLGSAVGTAVGGALGGTLSAIVESGHLTSDFGWRRDPINGQMKMHHGVDIAAAEGSPVRAPAAGVVTFAADRGGLGNTVVLDHGAGKQSRFAHLKDFAVTPGQRVQAGDTIATVGSTGRSTGPHVHVELLENGHHLDPQRHTWHRAENTEDSTEKTAEKVEQDSQMQGRPK